MCAALIPPPQDPSRHHPIPRVVSVERQKETVDVLHGADPAAQALGRSVIAGAERPNAAGETFVYSQSPERRDLPLRRRSISN